MAEIMESVAGNLQQRIGQLVSDYETQIAILRANAAAQLEAKDEEIKTLNEQVATLLAEKDADVPKAEAKPARTAK